MAAQDCQFLDRRAIEFGTSFQNDIVCSLQAFLDRFWSYNAFTRVIGLVTQLHALFMDLSIKSRKKVCINTLNEVSGV